MENIKVEPNFFRFRKYYGTNNEGYLITTQCNSFAEVCYNAAIHMTNEEDISRIEIERIWPDREEVTAILIRFNSI